MLIDEYQSPFPIIYIPHYIAILSFEWVSPPEPLPVARDRAGSKVSLSHKCTAVITQKINNNFGMDIVPHIQPHSLFAKDKKLLY